MGVSKSCRNFFEYVFVDLLGLILQFLLLFFIPNKIFTEFLGFFQVFRSHKNMFCEELEFSKIVAIFTQEKFKTPQKALLFLQLRLFLPFFFLLVVCSLIGSLRRLVRNKGISLSHLFFFHILEVFH